MKIILSIICILLMNFTSLNPQTRSEEEKAFLSNCYDAYRMYSEVSRYETENYTILIIIGDYDSKVSCSIFYETKTEANYKFYIQQGVSNAYYPKLNSNGVYSVYNLFPNTNIRVGVYENSNRDYFYKLKIEDFEEYYMDHPTMHGRNEGFSKIYKLSPEEKTPIKTIMLSSVLLVIILSAIIIILIMAVREKGIFKQDHFLKEFKKKLISRS